MSTKAGTIGVAGRPTAIAVWIGIVSALAATALVVSAVALTEARRDRGSVVAEGDGRSLAVATSQAPLWDAGKLEAMRGRVLADTASSAQGYALWDAGKVEAMRGRVLAESARIDGYEPWDSDMLEAMRGRVLAEG